MSCRGKGGFVAGVIAGALGMMVVTTVYPAQPHSGPAATSGGGGAVGASGASKRVDGDKTTPAAKSKLHPWQRTDAERWLRILPRDRRNWMDSRPPNLDTRLYDGEKALVRNQSIDGVNVTEKLRQLGCRPPFNTTKYLEAGKPAELDIVHSGCRSIYLNRTHKRQQQLRLLLNDKRVSAPLASNKSARRVYLDFGGNTIFSFHGFLKEYDALREHCFDAVVFEPGPHFRDQWVEAADRQRQMEKRKVCKLPWRKLAARPNKTSHPRMRSWVGLPVEFIEAAAWTANTSLAFYLGPGEGPNAGRVLEKSRKMTVRDMGDTQRKKYDYYPAQGIDIAEFIRSRYRPEDFVVVKMDVEGAEHTLIPHLVKTGAVELIDEIFVECHCRETWNKNRWNFAECYHLMMKLFDAGVYAHEWF
eukprot:TRINITY_DN39537_c0_g1_i1.p1 TRINITY_DN39537_c0_g1~~TRINITY_DN39537_c0_g1_i1.p1  ORF type:complete len:448 (+),score=134.98 TRINITY_DN39537_c0_g1_i1:97-1344(+)